MLGENKGVVLCAPFGKAKYVHVRATPLVRTTWLTFSPSVLRVRASRRGRVARTRIQKVTQTQSVPRKRAMCYKYVPVLSPKGIVRATPIARTCAPVHVRATRPLRGTKVLGEDEG